MQTANATQKATGPSTTNDTATEAKSPMGYVVSHTAISLVHQILYTLTGVDQLTPFNSDKWSKYNPWASTAQSIPADTQNCLDQINTCQTKLRTQEGVASNLANEKQSLTERLAQCKTDAANVKTGFDTAYSTQTDELTKCKAELAKAETASGIGAGMVEQCKIQAGTDKATSEAVLKAKAEQLTQCQQEVTTLKETLAAQPTPVTAPNIPLANQTDTGMISGVWNTTMEKFCPKCVGDFFYNNKGRFVTAAALFGTTAMVNRHLTTHGLVKSETAKTALSATISVAFVWTASYALNRFLGVETLGFNEITDIGMLRYGLTVLTNKPVVSGIEKGVVLTSKVFTNARTAERLATKAHTAASYARLNTVFPLKLA